MNTVNKILEKVNHYIDALPYERKPESLYEPIRYVLSIGGKRIRPVLMLLSYNLYRDDVDKILSVACGLETYHNYTLLHDDLMDQAPMRRGMPTVHRKWDANTAILSGDSMLVLAFQRIADCDDNHLRDIVKLFTETALEIGEGQQFDMDFEQRTDVSEEEYINMIRLKTSVLLACATKMGACLADASPTDADLLYHFGEKLGLAFQLQDDFLDVYGNPAVFGKAIGGDITSNKKTYMLINALNRANEQQRAELLRWIQATDFDRQKKIEAVTRIYNELAIDKLAQERIAQLFEECLLLLDQLPVVNERKEQLRQYAHQLMLRDK